MHLSDFSIITKAITQIIAESNEPKGGAKPICTSDAGHNFEAKYAPGILTKITEIILWIKEIIDFPNAQKYPEKQK